MFTPPIRAMPYPRKEKLLIVAPKRLIFKLKAPTMLNDTARSALPLFVPRILADHAHDALSADDLAVAANPFYRCQYFHVHFLPKNNRYFARNTMRPRERS